MSVSTTPPPAPPKKKGIGCLGCGCLVAALLVILFLGLMAGIGYWIYAEGVALTSTTSPDIPSFNGSDDLYLATRQKLADFDHDVENHQAATLQLSADEINTLLARSPDMIKYNIHAFVTLSNNEGRIQMSLPTAALTHGMVKDRYFTCDTSFEVHFDPQIKGINVTPHALQIGNKILIDPSSTNEAFIRSFNPAFNQSFNADIRQNTDGAALLDQAKSIEIQDGELVIETQ